MLPIGIKIKKIKKSAELWPTNPLHQAHLIDVESPLPGSEIWTVHLSPDYRNFFLKKSLNRGVGSYLHLVDLCCRDRKGGE